MRAIGPSRPKSDLRPSNVTVSEHPGCPVPQTIVLRRFAASVHISALRSQTQVKSVRRRRLVEHVPSPRRYPTGPVWSLTRDERIRRLVAAPHPIARLVLQAAFGTGLRLGELCPLHGDHIDPVHRSNSVDCGAVPSLRLPYRTERSSLTVQPRTAFRWFRFAVAAELPHLLVSGLTARIAALMAAPGHGRLATTSSAFVDFGAPHRPLYTHRRAA